MSLKETNEAITSILSNGMEGYFATFAFVSPFLVFACAEVDISVENVDVHSPFSEEIGNDFGNRVFTKEELGKYNGENVSF